MKRFAVVTMMVLSFQPAGAAVNRGLAVLSSVAFPGSGQFLLGARSRGEALMWVDGAVALTWVGSSWYGASREADARLRAARDAGALPALDDERYYKALERYDNIEEQEEDLRREARSRHPDDPAAQRSYFEQRRFPVSAGWDWSSDSARFAYWRTRKSARSAALSAGFAGGALLLGRVVSVLDCAFFAAAGQASGRVEAGVGDHPASIELRYRF
jgi:hypothetical protein